MGTVKTLRTSAKRKLPAIYKAHEGKCIWCGCETILMRTLAVQPRVLPHDAATVDHIIPLEYGGDSADDNLALACSKCNNERSARSPSRYAECVSCHKPTGKRQRCKECRQKRREGRQRRRQRKKALALA